MRKIPAVIVAGLILGGCTPKPYVLSAGAPGTRESVLECVEAALVELGYEISMGARSVTGKRGAGLGLNITRRHVLTVQFQLRSEAGPLFMVTAYREFEERGWLNFDRSPKETISPNGDTRADADTLFARCSTAGWITHTLGSPVHHIGIAATEPMIVEHPNGTLFLSGYGKSDTAPLLWKSSDGGSSWARVDVGTTVDDDFGGADVDLAIAPDGTLYLAAMGFDSRAWEGRHIAMGVSRDVGVSWSWTYLSQDRYDDRPWVEVAPNGTAHAIWNDGSGVSHAVSEDGGRTWTELDRVYSRGGSSHFAIGPNGELAVRILPMSASGRQYDEGVDLIAVSVDGGRNWRTHPAPGRRVWNSPRSWTTAEGVQRWVEPIAWDGSGMLYHLSSEGRTLTLSRSSDQGTTWRSWTVVRGDEVAYFPYLAARGDGQLAATWFSGSGDALTANVARIDFISGDDGRPLTVWLDAFIPDTWSWSGDQRDSAGEYFPVVFLSGGDFAVATAIRNPNAVRHGFSWRRISAR